jgi:hypothetical protein
MAFAEDLDSKDYRTVIVRMLIDRQGTLVSGEVRDVQEGHFHSRFTGWTGFLAVMQDYINRVLPA